MATFVLIPGSGTAGSAYDDVAAVLEDAGHVAIPVDLPLDNRDAALPEYVEAAVEAVGEHRDLVVVGQSLGAFTAVGMTARVPVQMLILVCPMIPAPGETPGEWWEATGQEDAIADLLERVGQPSEWDEQAMIEIFLHDCPPERLADADRHTRAERTRIFGAPLELDKWPDIPTHVLAGEDDRFFPLAFQQRVARERLGIDPDVMPGGHAPMISRPDELAARLLAYVE